MSTQIDVPAPGQVGAQWAEIPPPTFNHFQFEASSFNCNPGANRLDVEDNTGDISTYGFAAHHLVLTGNLKIRAGRDALKLGDVLLAKDAAPSTWAGRYLVVVQANASRTIQGHPALQAVELHFRPAMQAEFESNAPTDVDAAGS